ncbi:hypothetical protein V8G54_007207 [Vigna mungo]|uniref:Uncharacterized protein n=1 Tax=Vigna mungo TaxID=3915 RepID=A0AAQ3P2V6_VIGMU
MTLLTVQAMTGDAGGALASGSRWPSSSKKRFTKERITSCTREEERGAALPVRRLRWRGGFSKWWSASFLMVRTCCGTRGSLHCAGRKTEGKTAPMGVNGVTRRCPGRRLVTVCTVAVGSVADVGARLRGSLCLLGLAFANERLWT